MNIMWHQYQLWGLFLDWICSQGRSRMFFSKQTPSSTWWYQAAFGGIWLGGYLYEQRKESYPLGTALIDLPRHSLVLENDVCFKRRAVAKWCHGLHENYDLRSQIVLILKSSRRGWFLSPPRWKRVLIFHTYQGVQHCWICYLDSLICSELGLLCSSPPPSVCFGLMLFQATYCKDWVSGNQIQDLSVMKEGLGCCRHFCLSLTGLQYSQILSSSISI